MKFSEAPAKCAADRQSIYTYASSDTAVTVDPTSGVVTPVTKGTITVNSGTISSYTAAEAKTITLTVENAQPTVTLSGAVGDVGEKIITAAIANSNAENMDFTCSINGVSKTSTRSGNGDVSYTFTAAEMNALTVGSHDITVSSAATTNNNDNTGTAIEQVVINQQIDATITPVTASFDKYTPADISVTKSNGDYTLAFIKNGTAALVSDTDYTISGNTVTISKTYLKTVPLDNTTLTFDYGMTTNPTLTITVSDTTLIRNIPVNQATGGTVSVSPTFGKIGDIITVTVTQPTRGKITVSPATATIGETITVTAAPDSGYKPRQSQVTPL